MYNSSSYIGLIKNVPYISSEIIERKISLIKKWTTTYGGVQMFNEYYFDDKFSLRGHSNYAWYLSTFLPANSPRDRVTFLISKIKTYRVVLFELQN